LVWLLRPERRELGLDSVLVPPLLDGIGEELVAVEGGFLDGLRAIEDRIFLAR